MGDLTKYIGKYVLCEWRNKNGFEQKWLRRITRVGKVQVFCDCQYILDCGRTRKDSGSRYRLFKKCAFRMYEKNGALIGLGAHLNNPDGTSKVTLIDDFDILKCGLRCEDLLERNLHGVLPKGHDMFVDFEEMKAGYPESFKIALSLIDDTHEFFGEIVKHLKGLFNLPVYKVDSIFRNIDTTHDGDIQKMKRFLSQFTNAAIHYHINYFGDNKEVITFKEHMNNHTISFWLFDDKIVFQTESGIGIW